MSAPTQAIVTPRQALAAALYVRHRGSLTVVAKEMGVQKQAVLALLQRAGAWMPHPRGVKCPCCERTAKHFGWCLTAWRRRQATGDPFPKPRECSDCGGELKRNIRGRCARCAYHNDPEFRARAMARTVRYVSQRATRTTKGRHVYGDVEDTRRAGAFLRGNALE